MAAVSTDLDKMPVVRKLADFDQKSGNLLERLVFNNRLLMIIACAIITKQPMILRMRPAMSSRIWHVTNPMSVPMIANQQE